MKKWGRVANGVFAVQALMYAVTMERITGSADTNPRESQRRYDWIKEGSTGAVVSLTDEERKERAERCLDGIMKGVKSFAGDLRSDDVGYVTAKASDFCEYVRKSGYQANIKSVAYLKKSVMDGLRETSSIRIKAQFV